MKTQKVTLSGDETGTMTYKQAVRLLEKKGYRQDRGTYPSGQEQITLENAFSDDRKLRRVFSWLTRIGASPKFGSRPIGWYQIHQCHAMEILKASAGESAPLRCKYGNIQARTVPGRWVTLMSAIELFQQADNRSRQ